MQTARNRNLVLKKDLKKRKLRKKTLLKKGTPTPTPTPTPAPTPAPTPTPSPRFTDTPNGRNMPTQHIVNIVGRKLVVSVWPPCCDMLGFAGSNLTIFKLEPATPNMSQHGGETHATCCAQQCCDMLRWDVAIFWPRLNSHIFKVSLNMQMLVL